MGREKEIKIGHPISGIVIQIKRKVIAPEHAYYEAKIKTDLGLTGTLNCNDLFYEENLINEAPLPPIGSRIETIITNFHDQHLYLSAKSSDLAEGTIQKFREFYNYMEKTTPGTIVSGTISNIRAFGIFVDIHQVPHHGLIEIVLSQSYPGKQLPYFQSDWPKKGDRIRCIVNYFRENNREIGLGWLPD